MQVLHVGTEMFPLLKTGGLGDVIGALPQAQNSAGIEARLLLPGFPAFLSGIKETVLLADLHTFAGPVSLRYGHYSGLNIYLIDAPHLYDRPGSPYHDSHQQPYGDNHLRFALLGWIACEIACGLDPDWRPNILHAHDWHAGLACAYLAARGCPAHSVFTVHNLAYQGLFSRHHLAEIELPDHFFQIYGLEYYGQISYLKAGLYYADHITTVSPTYAKEITLPEFGHGMEGLLYQRQLQGKLTGILNGVNTQIWNPGSDKHLTTPYRAKQWKKKLANKTALQTSLGLPIDAKKLLFTIISRFTTQKGLDLVLDALATFVSQNGQLAILGSGDAALEARFLDAAREYPESIAVKIGYDEGLSHRMIAGADVIMVPSRFEPCGLTQLYGLQYGTLPLVRHTGGLADTVTDCTAENLLTNCATGFVFYDYSAPQFEHVIHNAFALWQQPRVWHSVQLNAMRQDFSWNIAAQAYLLLYQHLLGTLQGTAV